MRTLQALPGPSTPGLFNLVEYGLAPRRFALRHAARFGRSYKIKSVLGDAVFTADPEHVRRVFSAEPEAFDSMAALSLRWLFGPRSVLITSGATHRKQRKLLAPPLAGQRLRAFGPTMQTLADQHVAGLQAGGSFRALDLSTAFTLEVIVRTVFGIEDGSEDEARELRQHLTGLVRDVPALAIFAQPLQNTWYPPWRRYLRVRKDFDTWLAKKIAQRRSSDHAGEDVLSLLLSMRYDDGSALDDNEIRDQLVTLLLAGHETTSLTVASCVSRLLREPEVLARLLAELDGAGHLPEDVQRLPWLSAVIDETLRIDPIVTDVARIARSDFALDDTLTLAQGEIVVVLIEALHQDPILYPDPTRFRPERFLERKFAPYEFAPFGGGTRRCLGAAFSDYETKILLATLLRRATFTLSDPRPEPRVRRNITMGPKHGVPLRVVSLH